MSRPCDSKHSLVQGLAENCPNCKLCVSPSKEAKQARAQWEEPEPNTPNFLQKAMSFAIATTQHLATGMKLIGEAEQKERLAICHKCELFKDNRCSRCGCNMEVKASWKEQQCPLNKWPIKFDKENLATEISGYRFNPSIIAHEDGYLFAFRNGWAGSDIYLVKLDRQFKAISKGIKLNLQHPIEAPYGREDPRLFYFRGKLHIAYSGVKATPILHTSVLYAEINQDLRVEKVFYPDYSRRSLWEKNWGFFEWNNDLFAIYTASPLRVLRIDGNSAELVHEGDVISWSGGEIRGGSSPYLVGKEFYCFFHDWIWKGERVYRMGLYTFENEFPFKLKRITREPILTANQESKPSDQWASVVYPGGAVLDEDRWVVALGIHDRWSEIRFFDKMEMEKMLYPV